MKKIIICSLLFVGLFGCSKEDPKLEKVDELLTEEQQFKITLMSKNWIITKYDLEFHLGERKEGLRSFTNNTIGISYFSITPDTCGWGETIDEGGLWKSYQVRFTETQVNGTFSYELTKFATEPNSCIKAYNKTSYTDGISNNWSYNAVDKVLTTNFGEPYKIIGGQDEYFEMKYKVISYNK